MEKEAYKYEAFISYRHCPVDRRWAKWLHRSLERWRAPKRLVREGFPRRLNKCFRDEEELATAPELSARIEEALRASRFLIVVCSPRVTQSQWVGREIRLFRELKRHDRILALLIEGEPRTAFPAELLELRREDPDGDGPIEEGVETIEPLAADVRIERTLHSEKNPHPDRMSELRRFSLWRLLATIIGCEFDDLRRREQERRMNTLRIWTGSAIAVIGLVATAAGAAIHYARVADQNREQAVRNLSQMHYERGLEHLANGRRKAAWSQFARAGRLTSEDPAVKSMLFGLLTNPVPVLPAERPLLLGGSTAQAALHPDRRHLLLTSLNGAVVISEFGKEPVFQERGLSVAIGSFSPSGDALLISDMRNPERLEGRVRLWKGFPRAGEEAVRTIPYPSLLRFALAPDERHLAFSSPLIQPETVHFCELNALERLETVSHNLHAASVEKIIPHPTGNLVLTLDDDGGAVLWNSATRHAIQSWGTGNEQALDVNDACFSPDGNLLALAFGGERKSFEVFDVEPLKPLFQKSFNADVQSVAFSRNGRLVAAGIDSDSTPAGGWAAVWECRKGKQISPWMRHADEVKHLDFAPDDRRLLVMGHKGEATLWDALSGRPLAALSHGPVSELAKFDDDGENLITVSRNGIGLLHRSQLSNRGSATWNLGDMVSRIAISPDGRLAAAVLGAGRDGFAVFSLATGELAYEPVEHTGEEIVDLRFTAGSGGLLTLTEGGIVSLRDERGALRKRLDAGTPIGVEGISPDQLESLGYRSMMEALGGTGKVLVSLNAGQDRVLVSRVDFSNLVELIGAQTDEEADVISHVERGRQFVSGLASVVEVYDANLEKTHSFRLKGKGYLVAPKSGEGHVCAMSAASAAEIFSWSLTDPNAPPHRSNTSSGLRADTLTACSAGRAAMAATSRSIEWTSLDPAAPRSLSIPCEHRPNAIRFSPDGLRIAAEMDPNRDSGLVRLFDAGTGETVGAPIQHKDTINDIDFSPDSRLVATASQDNTARVWDASTGRLAMPPCEHEADVYDVEFSPDGRWLVSAGSDKTVRIWPIPDLEAPLPEWVMDLGEGLAEERYDPATGLPVPVDPARLFGAIEQVRSHAPSGEPGSWSGLATMLVRPPRERPLLPGTDQTVAGAMLCEAALLWGNGRRRRQLASFQAALDLHANALWMDPSAHVPDSIRFLGSWTNFEPVKSPPTFAPPRNDAGIELAWCPPGGFEMGVPEHSDPHRDNQMAHPVIQAMGFWIGKTEVTQAQWRVIMGTNPVGVARAALEDPELYIPGYFPLKRSKADYAEIPPPQDVSALDGYWGPDKPMIFVTWSQARDFCDALTARERAGGRLPDDLVFRLPTESEWEYACTCGGRDSAYARGFEVVGLYHAKGLGNLAWYGGNASQNFLGGGLSVERWGEREAGGPLAGPHNVAEKTANRWGIFDMLGNAREWCLDSYSGSYGKSHVQSWAVNPLFQDEGTSLKSVKGGSWHCAAADVLASARAGADSNWQDFSTGFRVVLAPRFE